MRWFPLPASRNVHVQRRTWRTRHQAGAGAPCALTSPRMTDKSPRVLIQVALEPRSRDAVVDAADRVLDAAEEPLDSLSVRQAVHVDAVAVADRAVRVGVSEREV